jgi:hypothetical protein
MRPTPLDRAGARLALGVRDRRRQHFLHGQPLARSEGLELLLSDGRWIPGRYDQRARKALFAFSLAGEEVHDVVIVLPPTAIVRRLRQRQNAR